MNTISSSAIDSLFSVTVPQQTQKDSIAAMALSRGTDAFTNGDYDTAITEFKRTVGLSPYSDNSLKALQLMVNAYKQQGKTDDEIKTWQLASKLFPQSDIPYSGLGDIYFGQKNYAEAEKAYTMAVRLNPAISSNVYALGQVYMAQERYSDAEVEFKKATLYAPTDPSGYYALGQVYRKMGRLDDAVTLLNKSIQINGKFADAHLELGMVYADMKNNNAATDQYNILANLDESSSTELQNYMFKIAAPKIIAAYNTSGFEASSGPGTTVSSMDPDLSDPGSSKLFTMNFIFSKDLDPSSVQNIANWLISRSSVTDPGGPYDWGLPTQSSEASISPLPVSVIYNNDNLTATVSFKISQNSTGDATLDPQHIMFKFLGADTYGNIVDQSADQYSGISQIA